MITRRTFQRVTPNSWASHKNAHQQIAKVEIDGSDFDFARTFTFKMRHSMHRYPQTTTGPYAADHFVQSQNTTNMLNWHIFTTKWLFQHLLLDQIYLIQKAIFKIAI